MNDENNNQFSNLTEVYSAIQGEGPLVGVRQIFVRFSGCDLRCVWCDTPVSLNKTKKCLVEQSIGRRDFKEISNPISVNQLIDIFSSLNPEIHHSVSVTGGEPLLQWDFLKFFLPIVKDICKLPIYLESGGHRTNELLKLVKYIDFVSMDIKLPSSASCGVLWEKHFEFLRISLEHNLKTWIKIVVSDKTDFNELEYALNNIKSIAKDRYRFPVILQPVTQIKDILPPAEITILKWQNELLKIFPDVRVIPQTHKFINQR